MNKTNFNEKKDSRYVSPVVEFCRFMPETCILQASTAGDAEGYTINNIDDLWL